MNDDYYPDRRSLFERILSGYGYILAPTVAIILILTIEIVHCLK